MTDDFLAPLTGPTRYFEGQDELFELLLRFGLGSKDSITVVHLVARAKEKIDRNVHK